MVQDIDTQIKKHIFFKIYYINSDLKEDLILTLHKNLKLIEKKKLNINIEYKTSNLVFINGFSFYVKR